MVVGKPYIHFKINNEPVEITPDYNYTWATTVEATKGPVNQPTLVTTANQAFAIFGVDMRPYFAQGAESLIIVRVAAGEPTKGVYSFTVAEPISIFRTEQVTFTTEKVYQTKAVQNGQYVLDEASTTENPIYEHKKRTYVHRLFYVEKTNGDIVPVIEKRTSNGKIVPGIYVDSWNNDGTVIDADCIRENNKKKEHTAANLLEGDGMDEGQWDPEDYKRTGLVRANEYPSSQVKAWLKPQEYIIQAGTTLFNVTSKYEGDYGITVSVVKSDIHPNDIGYNIILNDPSLGSIKINNAYDPIKIVNRINDRGFNFEATLTNAGRAISEAIASYPICVDVDNSNVTYGARIKPKLETAQVPEHVFIARAKDANDNVTFLTCEQAQLIAADEANGTSNASVKPFDYAINLTTAKSESLIGSSNGAWDAAASRIPAEYQEEAHTKGLNLLRRLRIAGIFCMYGENSIQHAYVEHGINTIEPEKGMNNNETCKWRTIILGANASDRDSKSGLAARATALNDQYTLLLGQGLIDTGFDGVAVSMSDADRMTKLGVYDAHQLLPYECTQYIAGLRSKLTYDESIFGGQGRKRIRSVGDLEIAPLFDYATEYEWDPNTYTYLNEAGVLTFTEEYGNITLTDGVTTCQKGFEEDEEGVMNILKYAQNGIYDICLPYIGRNINSDLQQSITMEIQSFLETMKSSHQSLIDTDEFKAYEFDVSLGARNTQLLGKIFITLKITPVHALRQIEVDMTVQ